MHVLILNVKYDKETSLKESVKVKTATSCSEAVFKCTIHVGC